MPEMKTLTIGDTTYTIVDEEARKTVANLLDKTEVTVQLTDMTGYLLKISGKVVASSTGNVKRIVSEPVYASAGDKYTITCSANYGNALYVIYDSSGAVLSYEIADSTESGTVLSNTEIIMPENTSYFRLASNLDNNPTGYSAAKIVLVPATTGKGKWSGIKWVVIGDSLTEKNKRTTKHYYDYIAEQTGITVEIMGVSGSGYVAGKDDGDAFYQRVASIPTDADVITIFGSGNDLSAMESLSLSMGTGADTGSASPTTVAGYVANAIQAIYDALPTVQLGVISPTPWQYHSPADADDDMGKYADMLKDVCAKRGIPYLDLFRCSGLRPWDAEFRTLAYSKDDGDGTHPDEMGHAMIAPRIKEFLGTMLYQDRPVAVGSGAACVYIGANKPTDGAIYWLDTSDSNQGNPVNYTVTTSLTHVTIDNNSSAVNEGASFAAALTADTGYALSSVSITMGGTDITGACYASGNIYIASVTGNIVITATAAQSTVTTYTITNSLVNVTSSNAAVSIAANAAYTATLTAADGYTLDAVTVAMGGADVTADVYADGVISIASVTGNVVITATAVEGVWEALTLTSKTSGTAWAVYSDAGDTSIGSVAGKGCYYSATFSADTEVKIELTMTGSVYSNIFVGSATSGVDGGNLLYAEVIPKVGSGYLADDVFETSITVKSGYQCVIGGVASNQSSVEAWKRV